MYSPDKMMGSKGLHGAPITAPGCFPSGRYSPPPYRAAPDPMPPPPRRCMPNPTVSEITSNSPSKSQTRHSSLDHWRSPVALCRCKTFRRRISWNLRQIAKTHPRYGYVSRQSLNRYTLSVNERNAFLLPNQLTFYIVVRGYVSRLFKARIDPLPFLD